MKAFKKFCLLTIISYTIFIISFIAILRNFPGSLWQIFSYYLGYFAIASFGYVYIFVRLENKRERILRNFLIATASIFILLLVYNVLMLVYHGFVLGRFFLNPENFYASITSNYFLCFCIFLLEYLGMTLLAYSSKSYKLDFDEKIFFYIKLIVSISIIVSLFGMVLILTEIESAFPSFDYLFGNNLLYIFLDIGVHCLLITTVSLALIWALSRFLWLKENSLFMILLLFLSQTFLLRLQVRVYDNHYLNSFFDPSTLSAPLLMVVLLYRNNQKNTDFKLKSLANAVSKKEAEYSQLKQQVNPHFLFNNLNTLISFIEINPKKAVEFGHHLSNTYRHYLKNQTEDFVSLQGELDFIAEYLAIYKAKFENGFTFALPSTILENQYILSSCMQELVDNVFKHNNLEGENPLVIEIFIELNSLVIQNTINRKEVESSSNFGLNNIKKRYLLLTNSDIQITETKTHFKVTIPILELES